MAWLIDLFFHLDDKLLDAIRAMGPGVYLLLFAVVFCETGLIIFPFLPGDSLLFAAGLLANPEKNALNIWLVSFTFFFAAIIGDSVNFWIGRRVGEKLFSNPNSKLFKRKHLESTQEYFNRHGARTVVIGRFIPIVRTLTPFVAGMQTWSYPTFLKYSVFGSFLWVLICTGGGYFFGRLPIVEKNFEWVILGVAVATMLLALVEVIRGRREKAHEAASTPKTDENA